MLKGVSEKEYKIILDVLCDYDAEFFAYGSRVKGDFSPLSDLDIMIKSLEFEKILPELKEKFDKSYLPYVVNFVNFSALDENFYNLIKDDLVKLC